MCGLVDHLQYGEFPQGEEVGSSKEGVENLQEKKDCFARNVFEEKLFNFF